ncbi:MAG: hypothetical protein HOV79_14305 [Hamadaea sp.]|nr:hypothetical protein [Hamadaea sp.]
MQRDVFGRKIDGPTRWERRKQKIRDEIERNNRGEYKVPTWVLTALLVAFVVGFTLFLVLA